jgi:outer membrane biosynthesis protein TonB
VPDRRSIFRLLALAGFLLTVALALWLAELRPLLVGTVMAVALLLAWVIGWLSWRQDSLRPGVEDREVKEEEAVVSGPPPPVLAPSASQEPSAAPIAEDPSPPAEPEPVATPAPKPQPTPRPPLRPVPTPPPHPVEPPAPQPARPAARASGVIDMRTRVTAQPRRWNLWDLERRARNEAERDPVRYEEWSFLFVHLRQFATPDGSLPIEFDELVRESFGELLEHAG